MKRRHPLPPKVIIRKCILWFVLAGCFIVFIRLFGANIVPKVPESDLFQHIQHRIQQWKNSGENRVKEYEAGFVLEPEKDTSGAPKVVGTHNRNFLLNYFEVKEPVKVGYIRLQPETLDGVQMVKLVERPEGMAPTEPRPEEIIGSWATDGNTTFSLPQNKVLQPGWYAIQVVYSTQEGVHLYNVAKDPETENEAIASGAMVSWDGTVWASHVVLMAYEIGAW